MVKHTKYYVRKNGGSFPEDADFEMSQAEFDRVWRVMDSLPEKKVIDEHLGNDMTIRAYLFDQGVLVLGRTEEESKFPSGVEVYGQNADRVDDLSRTFGLPVNDGHPLIL